MFRKSKYNECIIKWVHYSSKYFKCLIEAFRFVRWTAKLLGIEPSKNNLKGSFDFNQRVDAQTSAWPPRQPISYSAAVQKCFSLYTISDQMCLVYTYRLTFRLLFLVDPTRHCIHNIKLQSGVFGAELVVGRLFNANPRSCATHTPSFVL